MNPRGSRLVLFRYIAGEFLLSFGVAFLFFFFIFFINQILLMAEQILSKNVAPADVAKLIIYAIPNIISYSFPFSTLVGGLMAVGRLGGDNEILAMQSAGLPLRRIAAPIFVMGIALGGLAFMSNDILLPLGTMKFNQLYREILYSNPALELDSYSVKRYQDRSIITGRVERDRIDGIVIIDRDEQKNRRSISAATAILGRSAEEAGIIKLILENVTVVTADAKRSGNYEYSLAEKMEYNILLRDISLAVHSLTPREKSVEAILQEIELKEESLQARRIEQELNIRLLKNELRWGYLDGGEDLQGQLQRLGNEENRVLRDRSLQLHLLEFHKKIALPAACLVFLFFAFPAGILSRRSGRSIGFGLGLFVTMVYWGLLFAGQTLGIRSDFPPLIAVWGANLVILASGMGLSIIRSRK